MSFFDKTPPEFGVPVNQELFVMRTKVSTSRRFIAKVVCVQGPSQSYSGASFPVGGIP